MMARERALAKIRAIARQRGAVGVEDLRGAPAVYASLLHHFGSLDAARAVAGVEAPRAEPFWSIEKVIADLHGYHRKGIAMTCLGLSKHGARGLVNAARALFGGLPAARRAAGIPDPKREIIERVRWDEDTIVSEIRALHRAGEWLAASRVPHKLLQAGIYHFGSWRAAVETAGLDYDRVRLIREPWDRKALLAYLRDVARRRPKATLSDLHRDSAAPAWTREFGSIEAAADAAGLRDWPIRETVPLDSGDRVVHAIRARQRDERSIRAHMVEVEDPHLYRSALRNYGSWDAAIVAAGFTPAVARRWTKTAVRDALTARRRAGRSNNPRALRADDEGLYQAAREYLGFSAELAIKKFGAKPLRVRWTRENVIEALREHHGASAELRPCIKVAAIQLFGSMNAARESAGLPILRSKWDRKRVVREICALRGTSASAPLRNAGERLFGSWRAALAAAAAS